MDHKILYDGTEAGLKKQVDEHIADGWRTMGDHSVIEPEIESEFDIPKFVFFAQTVVKLPESARTPGALQDQWDNLFG